MDEQSTENSTRRISTLWVTYRNGNDVEEQDVFYYRPADVLPFIISERFISIYDDDRLLVSVYPVSRVVKMEVDYAD
jgi:hypothetical protein